ncbi:hypothetical protein JOF29_007196 [Kribbella aluminosa]|uniref:Uncharacterized protein n=1 Tax=Kribbella aluminosa TaxID=416017 RepID=A0ABS4UWT4_9ACTN|nr:hypothetical protein [Kribbella aluminosa]
MLITWKTSAVFRLRSCRGKTSAILALGSSSYSTVMFGCALWYAENSALNKGDLALGPPLIHRIDTSPDGNGWIGSGIEIPPGSAADPRPELTWTLHPLSAAAAANPKPTPPSSRRRPILNPCSNSIWFMSRSSSLWHGSPEDRRVSAMLFTRP